MRSFLLMRGPRRSAGGRPGEGASRGAPRREGRFATPSVTSTAHDANRRTSVMIPSLFLIAKDVPEPATPRRR